ncbi:Hypothetical predicted protein [Cloeon dipterum]|uniref:Ig-like domain-containing protein n=1 Tax=Cloeon dipterum TaxID=197152 RepID=A0A8S1E3U2_9INSE|nr:Hypothetical predicted protein [Cloeon dipterum]
MEELSRDHHRPVTHRARSALDQDTAVANVVNKRHRLKAAPPKLYAIPHNKVVEEGATVRLQCAIAGHPTPWVIWDTDGLILTPSRRLTIKEKDDLRIVEISEVSVEDAGLYRVTLENDVGRVEAIARLDSSIEELCQKDKLLEDQRKIIVEIQIKLDEKQMELEELRQSLDTQDSAVD